MKQKKLIITGLVIQSLLAGAAMAADPIGQVIGLQGQATVQGTDGRAEQMTLRSDVFLNDRIFTEVGAKLQIMMQDDAIVSMGENSEMTLDEYVYSSEVKEENTSKMSFLKGVFRVITAKITDLNPEQFKVRSNMATIGIRGCELGFDIGADHEEIQIVRIPEGKEIVVSSLLNSKEVLNILQQGVMINLRAGSRMRKSPLNASDIKRIYDATMISVSGSLTRKFR